MKPIGIDQLRLDLRRERNSRRLYSVLGYLVLATVFAGLAKAVLEVVPTIDVAAMINAAPILTFLAWLPPYSTWPVVFNAGLFVALAALLLFLGFRYRKRHEREQQLSAALQRAISDDDDLRYGVKKR